MGTRNLTMVIHKGEVRMAQYGQFDGYPRGVGRDIAAVLEKYPLKKIRAALDRCVFVGQKKVDGYFKKLGHKGGNWVSIEISDQFEKAYPLLHRDISGGKALAVMLEREDTDPFELTDNREFAADSLFCEWCYVVDLDKKVVEVYTGFNQKPVKKDSRFAALNKFASPGRTGKYYPVSLFRSYPISKFTQNAMMRLQKVER